MLQIITFEAAFSERILTLNIKEFPGAVFLCMKLKFSPKDHLKSGGHLGQGDLFRDVIMNGVRSSTSTCCFCVGYRFLDTEAASIIMMLCLPFESYKIIRLKRNFLLHMVDLSLQPRKAQYVQ